ncbi:MAG: arsenate reductase (glutaredoxin), partial [Methylococcaceae bacterium]
LDSELTNHYNNTTTNGQHHRAQEDFHTYIKKRHQNLLKIYYNPRCSKSREGLLYIEQKGYEYELINYMKNGLSAKEIKDFLNKSGLEVTAIIRTNEELYKQQYKGLELSEEEWIKVLVENPQLLQRPLVIKGTHAVIARPAEEIQKLF